MSDEDILAMYIERNEYAIVATRSKYYNDIRMVVKRIIFNDEDTEECVNDTYFALWNSVHKNKPVHFRSYIIEIARRLAYSSLRRKLSKKRSAILIELYDTDKADCFDIIYDIECKEVMNCVRDFLSQQPEFNKSVFMMHYYKMVPIKIIAAIYGKNTDQLKMLLYRMRLKLKKYLSEQEITCF